LNGSNASAAFIPSGFAGSPSASGTASGSRPVAGGSLASGTSLGSSSSAGFGTSESSFEQENTSGSESGSSSSSSIDWSKNVQLNNSTLVAVGEGATLNIEGNVNLKKNQLGVSGAGNTDVTGKFVGLGTVRKSGSGVMTLYGKNSYNGNLIISEGTLLLGASNRLSDKIDVTLGGGSFNTGGFDENVGELTLTRDSIIDLGDGDSVLKFRDSSSSEWSSGEVVEIRNWSGAAGGGGQDQIYAGSSNRGLTEDQLKQIEFFDPFGENSGRFPARILPSGEIVPAPEPSTILAALGALGWIGFREKKRLLGWLKKFRSAG
jgi:autotransporter-associated beta strand protein